MLLIAPVKMLAVCKIAKDTSPQGNRAIVLAPVITCSQFSLTLFYLEGKIGSAINALLIIRIGLITDTAG